MIDGTDTTMEDVDETETPSTSPSVRAIILTHTENLKEMVKSTSVQLQQQIQGYHELQMKSQKDILEKCFDLGKPDKGNSMSSPLQTTTGKTSNERSSVRGQRLQRRQSSRDREVDGLLQQIETLDKDKQRLEDNLDEMEVREKRLQKKVDEMDASNQKLTEQTAKFRKMIIRNQGEKGSQVADDHVAQKYINLTSLIQRISAKCFPKDEYNGAKEPTGSKDPTQLEQEFIACWNIRRSDTERRNRVRGVLFGAVHRLIIAARIFGIRISKNEACNSIEAGLASFEGHLMDNFASNESAIVEWRVQTMKCARILAAPDDSIAESVAVDIHASLRPLLPDTARRDKTAEDLILTQLITLCRQAFAFAMMIRSCNDIYKCDLPVLDSVVNEEEMEPQAFEGNRGHKSDQVERQEIACVISGSLIKYPAHMPNERVVLCKADVVVRERNGV
ncbi:hypothetical protein VTL71DRAFT_2805 [Oculimacula yallundae]|uniref:Uncharacterized protein n=1 Tax=Oculimacula yallundae TaxID=86028 RepID=A0ABR4C9X4_9HELO